MWAFYPVLLVVVYCLFRLTALKNQMVAARIIRLFLILSLLGVGAGVLLTMMSDSVETGIGWSQIVSVSFVLSAVSTLIREYKPVHTRYPVLFVYMPLLLIPTFLLIDDSEILKDLLNMFLQGGALVVLLLISVTATDKYRYHLQFPAGVIAMTIAYLLFWFVSDNSIYIDWIWPLVFALALGLLGFSVPRLIEELESRGWNRNHQGNG